MLSRQQNSQPLRSSLRIITFLLWPKAGFLCSPLKWWNVSSPPLLRLAWRWGRWPLLLADTSRTFSLIFQNPRFQPQVTRLHPTPHSAVIYWSQGHSSFLESYGSWCTAPHSTTTPTTILPILLHIHIDGLSKSWNSWFLGLLLTKELALYPVSATHYHGHTQTLQLPITETPSIITISSTSVSNHDLPPFLPVHSL